MDSLRTPEQKAIANTVAKITGKYGHAYFVASARDGRKVEELWDEIAAAGYAGVNLPEKYGGGGGGVADLAVVAEEMAAQGCPLLTLIVSPAICGGIIARHGTEDQCRRWLPGLASGVKKMAFAITEPDSGSNSHEISLSAEYRDGQWHLNGAKYYVSILDEAEHVLVVARTGTGTDRRHRHSLFVVPTNSPGVAFSMIPVEMVAPEKQFTLTFDDVLVGEENLLGAAGEGLQIMFDGLNPERIMAAAISNGIGRYALTKAAGYARDRQVWGVPIGSHQGLAHPLAEQYIRLQQSRLMAVHAAMQFDNGGDAGEAANIAKFAAAEASLGALDQAIQTHGGNGLSTEYGLADLWFVARLLRTAPVSREMILNFVASHSLGLPRSY
ncbi:acyl-CoA dehydrogenase family protein [Terrabacter carboxydivorans]|uniref:Acyl-CoA dehydrogenase family protein n=1 Tax=Terrabacter carboxydivorans TaxID=619730 RepID=A0ABP5Y0K6_9MICO